MKTKTINGWVIWTRDTTLMEDGDCVVFRARLDAFDYLEKLYPHTYIDQAWRVAPVTMTCEVPVKPAAKKGGKRGKK